MKNPNPSTEEVTMREEIRKIIPSHQEHYWHSNNEEDCGPEEYDSWEEEVFKPLEALFQQKLEERDEYMVPMVEVNPSLKKEYDRGRFDEARSILEIGKENDGVNLMWLAGRTMFLEETLGGRK